MIWIIYYSIFFLVFCGFTGFLVKQKLTKGKLLFLGYYFILFLSVNLLNNFLALSAQKLTNSNSLLLLINILFPIVIIIFAIPATYLTAKLKKRKLYIWWFHIWLIVAALIGIFVTSTWVLIFTSVALGMGLSALGVHQLMFNEQHFEINQGFLSFILLLVITLLSNLLIYPIQWFFAWHYELSAYWLYFYLASLVFNLITMGISFWLKEDKNEVGIYEDFVLEKAKTYQWKHFIVLVILGLLFYLVFYATTNNLLNYKVNVLSGWLGPYWLLLTVGSDIIGAFVIGYTLYWFFGIRNTFLILLLLWIIALFGFIFFNNNLLLFICVILVNICFGISTFIIYSLILEWNFRQTMPLTGIYGAVVAILTLLNNSFTSINNFDPVGSLVARQIILIVLQSCSIVILLLIALFIYKTVHYWATEEKLIKKLEAK